MAERDWEGLAAALDAATGDYSRAELVELLRDLIAEYVVGRGLPTGTPNAAATPDVAAMNFPDLVRWLKRAASAPELQRFTVDGQRVVVELDGPRVISGAADGERPAAAVPASPPGRAPGIDFEEMPMRRPPAAAGASAGNAAPPRSTAVNASPTRTGAASAAGNRAGGAAGNRAGNPAGSRAGNPAENPVRPAPPLPPPADAPAGTHEDGTPKRGLSKGFRGLEFD
jgi:hypothetical protein